MTIQDDSREQEQRELFGLTKREDEGRSGVDAVMLLDDGTEVPFELKTTTKGSVTTVRDFGYDHIQKWKEKHWLISKYSEDGNSIEYSLYGSPKSMSKWINEKEEYIRPDFELAKIVPEEINISHLFKIVGKKQSYSLKDAKILHKKQYKIEEYQNLMDLTNGYTAERMLEILRDRCKYLIERGSTLNNPHIPASYFHGWEKITNNHANKLKELVIQSFNA